MRILIDIAMRALSPAVNDPTTGVQLTNQVELLLRGLLPDLAGERYLVVADPADVPRLIVPARTFADYLQLAVTEIREYGATSTQICLRQLAMLTEHCGLENAPVVAAELTRPEPRSPPTHHTRRTTRSHTRQTGRASAPRAPRYPAHDRRPRWDPGPLRARPYRRE
jgi:hypothetical protein